MPPLNYTPKEARVIVPYRHSGERVREGTEVLGQRTLDSGGLGRESDGGNGCLQAI